MILASVATDFLQGVFRLQAKSVKRIDVWATTKAHSADSQKLDTLLHCASLP